MNDEIKMELEEIKQIKAKLTSWLKNMCECSPNDIDLEELGKLMDTVKDAAETKEKCLEALYYKTAVEAMENADEYSDFEDRLGYNPNRRASGRYAPRGTGDMSMGYSMRYMPKMPDYYVNEYMGYNYSGQNGSNTSNNMSRNYSSSSNRSNTNGRYGYDMDENYDPRYGEAYNRYRMAKRHYTETNSDADRIEMDEHAVEHMNDLLSSAREIYKSSTPELRKKFMEDLNNMKTSLSSMA